MNASGIAEFLGCDRSQVARWKKAGELGDPVNPGDTRPRYPKSAIVELGQRKGYLDARGRRTEDKRDTSTRRRPIPRPHVPEGRTEMHYYVPDIAAIYGATEKT